MYLLLLINTLLIELAMNLPMGSLPLILEHEGAAREQITMAMGVGMLATVIVSIPIGALVDRIGRITAMKAAIAFTFVTLICLWLAHGPLASGILLGLRSFSMIMFMTAQSAYVSMLVPKERSVSAVATLGIMGSLAFATAPAFAVWLFQHGLGREQYLAANAIMVLAAIFLFFLPPEDKTHLSLEEGETRQLFRWEWLPATLFTLACTIQAGVNISLAVLAFHDRGIANGAILFTAAASTTVCLRHFAGRSVERFGPWAMSIPTAIAQALGCTIASSAATVHMVLAAGVCFGIAWAAFVPVALALYFEESTAKIRGAAIGAFHFAFGLGACLGAGLATIATFLTIGYTGAMTICAAAPLMALLPVFCAKRRSASMSTEEMAPVEAAALRLESPSAEG